MPKLTRPLKKRTTATSFRGSIENGVTSLQRHLQNLTTSRSNQTLKRINTGVIRGIKCCEYDYLQNTTAYCIQQKILSEEDRTRSTTSLVPAGSIAPDNSSQPTGKRYTYRASSQFSVGFSICATITETQGRGGGKFIDDIRIDAGSNEPSGAADFQTDIPATAATSVRI